MNTISPFDILNILAKQIRIILIIPSILCSITIINVLFFSIPVYKATSKIMHTGNAGYSQATGLASQFGISLPIDNSKGPNWSLPEIIKSRTFVKKVLEKKMDSKTFGQGKSLFHILMSNNDKPQMISERDIQGAVSILNGMIQIIVDRETKSIEIAVESSEPGLAAQINKAIIENLEDFQKDYYKNKNDKTRQFIEGRILETEAELKKAEDNLKNFSDRNRRISNSPTLMLEQERLSREVSVLTGVFTTLKQKLETTKIEAVAESEYVLVIDPPFELLDPIRPQKRTAVILAGIFGLGIGLIFAFIKQYIIDMDSDEKNKIAQVLKEAWKNLKV